MLPLNFQDNKTQELKLKAFRVRDAFFEEDEDLKAGRDRRFRELHVRIKKRIKELYKGNPHAKIQDSMPVLPSMPKKIGRALGQNRRLFKDQNKDRARLFNRQKVDEQLKFNDIRLTPPESPDDKIQ